MTDIMNKNEIRKNKAVEKLYEKLENAIVSKEFYHVHQVCRTIYNRLSEKDVEATILLLDKGVNFLLSNDQSESGADLALILLKFLREKKVTLSADIISKLKRYFSLISKKSEERKSFLVECDKLMNSQELEYLFNNWIAVIFWKENNYPEARIYFMKSGNGLHIGLFLIQYCLLYGYNVAEKDLFIVQAVLQLLCLQKIETAIKTFSVYVRNYPELEDGPPFQSLPLLNFVWLLLINIKMKKSESEFQRLRECYTKHLSRDPIYTNYLTKIGQLYFGVPVPRSQPNFLDSMLNAVLGSGGGNGNRVCRNMLNMTDDSLLNDSDNTVSTQLGVSQFTVDDEMD